VNARRLADGIALDTPDVLDPMSVETNIVFADTRAIGVAPFEMLERLRAAGVLANVVAGRIRLVTHRDITADQIEEAIGVWRRVAGESEVASA
jgi:threonine aldolase